MRLNVFIFFRLQFRLLATKLFAVPPATPDDNLDPPAKKPDDGSTSASSSSSLMDQDSSVTLSKPCSKHLLRNELFERLSAFYPEHMTHPRNNLLELIPYTVDLS